MLRRTRMVAIGLAFILMLSGCAAQLGYVPLKTSKSTKLEKHDIVVVGGGIAGLTCAYYLKDKDVLVLEKKSTVGGRTISGVHKSFTYAKGTEYLGKPDDPLFDLINELKLTPKEIPSPMDAYFDGKQMYYGQDGIKRFLIESSDKAAYKKFTNLIMSNFSTYDEIPDLTYDADVKRLDQISAAQWLNQNKIPEAFIQKYNVTAKGLFGANLNDISALSLIPEVAFDYEGGAVDADSINDYLDFDQSDIDEEYVNATKERSGSYSFEKGLTELTNKLGSQLKNKLRLNSTVIRVVKKGAQYEVTYLKPNGKSEVVLANQVVMAIPAPEVLNIAPSVFSKEKINLLKTVKYASYATVALYSDVPIFDKAFDLAVPDDYFFTDVYDATWIERHYNSNKKELKEYIASVYVAPKQGDDHALDAMSDQVLLKNIYKDLDKIVDSASTKVTGYDIERFPYAYPIMSPGAYKRLLRLNELNTGNVLLAGDYMIYPTFEAAVQSGYLAAEQILEAEDN